MPQEADKPLLFLRAGLEKLPCDGPFVIIVSSKDELNRWLHDSSPALQWIQVEELLADEDAWALAAQGPGDIPLDVVLSRPGSEFAGLYRLVDVLATRNVRVSMPATRGFLRSLRLAASLGIPIRLLPGQPSAEEVAELGAALSFYLHDPMVEAPIEFLHSALAWMRGARTNSLWTILEEDPAIFHHRDASGRGVMPRTAKPCPKQTPRREFVTRHLAKLVNEGAECASCPWQQLCHGYFKWPEPAYSCRGVKELFSSLRAAADEIGQELAAYEESTPCLTTSSDREQPHL